jgi:hypothetical protein
MKAGCGKTTCPVWAADGGKRRRGAPPPTRQGELAETSGTAIKRVENGWWPHPSETEERGKISACYQTATIVVQEGIVADHLTT